MARAERADMLIPDRPTDMLQRQLLALRKAVRYRNPNNRRRNFCHLNEYRASYLRNILAMRGELRKRK